MGKSGARSNNPICRISEANGREYTDGNVNGSGKIFGTYMHGLFHNAAFTDKFIDNLCSLRKLSGPTHAAIDKEKAYDDLAEVFRANLNMNKLNEIISGGIHG
jgi:adenosylcobyric acid synthase